MDTWSIARLRAATDTRPSKGWILTMTRAELITLASPPCHECATPVQRVENRGTLTKTAGGVSRWTMVCGNKHRVLVEPLM